MGDSILDISARRRPGLRDLQRPPHLLVVGVGGPDVLRHDPLNRNAFWGPVRGRAHTSSWRRSPDVDAADQDRAAGGVRADGG